MGTYDTIILKMKCPYCGETSKMDFQTKDGDYGMDVYKIGDTFQNGQFRKIDAIGSCESLKCQFEASKEHVWKYGYYGGFSRSFDVYIHCDSKGRITNKIKIYKLNHHKGRMKGILGELKGKEDNMKIVKYADWTGKGFTEAKMKPMTKNFWLDKFKEDSFDGGRRNYEKILYLFNLEDSEEAMMYWFSFRHRLDDVIDYLKGFGIKEDEVFASVFLSNEPDDLIENTLKQRSKR